LKNSKTWTTLGVKDAKCIGYEARGGRVGDPRAALVRVEALGAQPQLVREDLGGGVLGPQAPPA